MTAVERGLLNLLYLAGASQRKQQSAGRLRFLVLAVHKAGHAGYLSVAEACRELVQQAAPQHLLSRADSTLAALRSEEFAFFIRQLERSCSLERAEQLATGLGFDADAAVRVAGGEIELVLHKLLAALQGEAKQE